MVAELHRRWRHGSAPPGRGRSHRACGRPDRRQRRGSPTWAGQSRTRHYRPAWASHHSRAGQPGDNHRWRFIRAAARTTLSPDRRAVRSPTWRPVPPPAAAPGSLGLVVRPAQYRDAVRFATCDLDPHASVADHGGDRDHFLPPGRAALEQTVGHHLAGREHRDVTARVRRAKHAAHEHAGLPHLIWPPANVALSRTAAPAIRAPALPRPPAHGHPGTATRRREMHAPLSRQRQAGTHPPDRPPAAHTRARFGQAASTHSAPWPKFPSAMRPWTPQHNALQRYKVTHDGTEQKRPA